MPGSASATDWPGRPLEQRRDLQELEVARDGVRHVEVGVQAQLAEPRAVRWTSASSSSRSAWNVACSVSSGPKSSSSRSSHVRAERRARLLGERRRRLRARRGRARAA